MLAYFPQVYPGELLYSVLARYHRHMGAPSAIQSMEALFGRRLVVASVDLPGGLQALADRIPPGSGWTTERIINEMTLLPYYTVFQPAHVTGRAREAVREGAIDGLLMKLGMAAFRIPRVTQLRFCMDCLQAMQNRYGEYYWQRDCQLPGVLVCPEHGRPLQESTVSLTRNGRHVCVPATRTNCLWHAPALADATKVLAIATLHRLAKASSRLLLGVEGTGSFAQWTRHYRHGLAVAGLMRSAQHVDQRRLQEAFWQHYRDVWPWFPELVAGQRFRGDWLAAITRKHRKAFHPLLHVMLQDFLDHQGRTSPPFGEGPWPCVNPLAKHRGVEIISTVQMHRNHGHHVGVFACRCGYSYTRSYFPGSGSVGPARFQAYGPKLAPALNRMVADGLSLRATARRLELDPKTVIKLAGELGIVVPWRPRGKEMSLVQKRIVDGERLCKVSPPTRQDRRHASRIGIDWQETDRKVSQMIRQAAQALREQIPPVRISVLQIERQHWNRGWLSKRAHKFPGSMAYLRSVIESVGQFQWRRACWVIREMDRAGEPLRAWRVLRRAGLAALHTGMVEDALNGYFDGRRKEAA